MSQAVILDNSGVVVRDACLAHHLLDCLKGFGALWDRAMVVRFLALDKWRPDRKAARCDPSFAAGPSIRFRGILTFPIAGLVAFVVFVYYVVVSLVGEFGKGSVGL